LDAGRDVFTPLTATNFRIGAIKEISMAATDKTGTRDTVYDLVSIIYHALQGAETYGMYVTDAEEVGDTELAKFFQEVQDEERRRADRAKQFLAARLGR
jgi:rubrerythrin